MLVLEHDDSSHLKRAKGVGKGLEVKSPLELDIL